MRPDEAARGFWLDARSLINSADATELPGGSDTGANPLIARPAQQRSRSQIEMVTLYCKSP